MAADRQPRVADRLEAEPRRGDGWIHHLGLSTVVTSDTTTDVFADRDDSIGVRDRTMVEWALEPDPKARREPSHRAEALDQGFVLIVEHPRRREAVVEVRVVMSGGVHGPVPQDQIEIVIRESRPTELPCRVELFQGRSAPQRPQVDHIDIRESGPGRERGIRIRRQEVRAEVLGKDQGHAFTTPDCLQKIVQHGDSHARPPTPSRLAGDPRAGRQRASHHARTASRNETLYRRSQSPTVAGLTRETTARARRFPRARPMPAYASTRARAIARAVSRIGF